MKEYIDYNKAHELLGAESGTRPRIYGLWWDEENDAEHIVALRSRQTLEGYTKTGILTSIWLSNTKTVPVGRA